LKRTIAVIDAETDPFRKGRIPRPFIWGFYDGSIYLQFDTTEALAAHLRETDCICYAHNGGKFDFHYLIEYFEAWDNIKIINGRIAQAWIGICELRDSYLIINEPLSKYKKDDIDYSIMEPGERDYPVNRRKIEAYLKSDCVYLWEMVTEFLRLYGNTLTQAGAAMKQWIKISNDPPPETDQEYYNLFSPYYYGGRVECFESGVIDTKFNVYDINSAYAFAMTHKHPYSANYERINGYVKNADFYRINCISYGALPYRGNGSDSGFSFGLSFPNDNKNREYTVTGWELASGITTKSLRRIRYLESFRFMRHKDFGEYINHFWRKREAAKAAGDILGSLMAKLMMNSLYGKFAANPENYYNYMIVPRSEAAVLGAGVPLVESDENGNNRSWQFGGEFGCWLLAQRQLDDFQRRYYNIATGASITGFVRAMLWRAIHSSERVLYVDTDSVACISGGAGVSVGGALGQWKHEGVFDKAGIAGKKLYIFRGLPGEKGSRNYKTASKGARLTHAQLWKLAHGGEVYYERDTPTYSVSKPLDFENPENSFTNRLIVNTAKKR
jgi:hypothetical protein